MDNKIESDEQGQREQERGKVASPRGPLEGARLLRFFGFASSLQATAAAPLSAGLTFPGLEGSALYILIARSALP